MPRLRPSPIGLAITAFEIWRRLPPSQRRQLVDLSRRHGPKVAAAILTRRRRTL